jgi:acetyl-CoA C-acetyltransferase
MQDLVVSGGTEMMSLPKKGMLPMGAGNPALQELHPQSHQGVCADAIATIEGIGREVLDALASSRSTGPSAPSGKAASTAASSRCTTPTAPWRSTTRSSPGRARRSRGSPAAAELPGRGRSPLHEDAPTFRELINQKYPDVDIQHVHHAGNSSGVVDGSAAILWASSDYAKAHGMTARARVVATANMGDCPTLMLNAPVPAARKVLEKAGLTVDDIDLFEVNEAFAVVAEKFMRDLDLDRDKVNVNGGAMALGHPIGATGAMLIGTVLDELERRDGQFGLITMCAGGGMAPAIIIERSDRRSATTAALSDHVPDAHARRFGPTLAPDAGPAAPFDDLAHDERRHRSEDAPQPADQHTDQHDRRRR